MLSRAQFLCYYNRLYVLFHINIDCVRQENHLKKKDKQMYKRLDYNRKEKKKKKKPKTWNTFCDDPHDEKNVIYMDRAALRLFVFSDDAFSYI